MLSELCILAQHNTRPPMTQCNTKTTVDFHPDLPVEVTFEAPEISSDGGWVLLRAIDEQLGLTEAVASVVPDERDPSKVEHSRLEQVRQRVFQLAMGYEDCLDADRLREDRLLKTVCDRRPEDEALSSQPTLSLLENAVDMRAICRMLFVLEFSWMRSLEADREVVVLDVDSSGFEAHGQQELISYCGFHGAHIYHPLAVFDGQTGQLVTALLRPGDVGDSRGAPNVLERVITRLKVLRPEIDVVVRGDSGFATPRPYRTLEELDERFGGVDYLIGISRNSVLERELRETMDTAVETYERTGQKSRKFVGFEYQAQSWEKPRWVVGKAEVGPEGENPRFVLGPFRGFPGEMVYRAYCGRGESEQWVDAFKNQVDAQKLSCSSYTANFFRIILCALAYRILRVLSKVIGLLASLKVRAIEAADGDVASEMLETLARLEHMARAEFETLRTRILKVAAVVNESTRRIHLDMPAHFPWQRLFRNIVGHLKRGPPIG